MDFGDSLLFLPWPWFFNPEMKTPGVCLQIKRLFGRIRLKKMTEKVPNNRNRITETYSSKEGLKLMGSEKPKFWTPFSIPPQTTNHWGGSQIIKITKAFCKQKKLYNPQKQLKSPLGGRAAWDLNAAATSPLTLEIGAINGIECLKLRLAFIKGHLRGGGPHLVVDLVQFGFVPRDQRGSLRLLRKPITHYLRYALCRWLGKQPHC